MTEAISYKTLFAVFPPEMKEKINQKIDTSKKPSYLLCALGILTALGGILLLVGSHHFFASRSHTYIALDILSMGPLLVGGALFVKGLIKIVQFARQKEVEYEKLFKREIPKHLKENEFFECSDPLLFGKILQIKSAKGRAETRICFADLSKRLREKKDS